MKLSHRISVAILSLALLGGVSAGTTIHSAHAAQIDITAVNPHRSQQQSSAQNHAGLIKRVNHNTNANQDSKAWFTDGLNQRELASRGWITRHESGNHWNVLSYGGRCIGYFQLDPAYLGKKNGHVNLNHQHQVKVADTYAKSRYGSWHHAKAFWQIHHWY